MEGNEPLTWMRISLKGTGEYFPLEKAWESNTIRIGKKAGHYDIVKKEPGKYECYESFTYTTNIPAAPDLETAKKNCQDDLDGRKVRLLLFDSEKEIERG